jgi:hypothetical protein
MTMATTTTAHTAGVTCFELPLRGESLAAWLNSLFIENPDLAENRQQLVPKRRIFAIAVMPRRRRLRRADRIGSRKTIHQPGCQFGVRVPVGQDGFAGIGGVFVVRRGIESLSHEDLHGGDNALAIQAFPSAHRNVTRAPFALAVGPIQDHLPPVSGADAKPAADILSRDQYCTDRRWQFGSTMSAMRLHPHRCVRCFKDNFRPQPVGV